MKVHDLAEVVHRQAFCHATTGKTVNVHFFDVGFTEAAADKDGFVAAFLAALGEGEFAALDAEGWEGGPSYIHIGAWIGDQTLALLLMGLIEFHDLGKVITPTLLGMTGEQADQMAGLGLVMCQVKRGALA